MPLPSDVSALLRTMYSYRFLTYHQLRKLHPQQRPATLGLYIKTRLIAAIKRPTINSRVPDVVYTLDRAGADVLTLELDVDRANLRWRAHMNRVGLLFLEHRLAANDVRIALTIGARRVGAEVMHWYNEPVIEEQVIDPVTGIWPLAFRPDAYARLMLPTKSVMHAFIEVDRGSEGYAKIEGKARRYVAYKEHRAFRTSTGARSFRVLFTVPTTRRLLALKRVIEGAEGRQMFWLARQRDVVDMTFDAPIWSMAGSEQRVSLVTK